MFVRIDVAQIILSAVSWLISSGSLADNSAISGDIPLKMKLFEDFNKFIHSKYETSIFILSFLILSLPFNF